MYPSSPSSSQHQHRMKIRVRPCRKSQDELLAVVELLLPPLDDLLLLLLLGNLAQTPVTAKITTKFIFVTMITIYIISMMKMIMMASYSLFNHGILAPTPVTQNDNFNVIMCVTIMTILSILIMSIMIMMEIFTFMPCW